MSKAARQRTAREKLAAERRRHEQRSRRIRSSVIGVGALLMTGVLVTAVVIAQSDEDLPTSYRGELAPVSRQADGSVLMAKPGVAGPLLEIFEDFQCPSCKELEDTGGNMIKELAAEGRVRVVYRPFHLFAGSPEPTRSNSRRAANAALCAPVDRWIAYHDVLFEHQPNELKEGFKNADLIRWGRDAGITDPAFDKCVTGEQKSAQLTQTTGYATVTRKVQGTPTLFVNGRKIEDQVAFSPKALRAAILGASSAPIVTASATPATPATPAPRTAAPATPAADRKTTPATRKAAPAHRKTTPATRAATPGR